MVETRSYTRENFKIRANAARDRIFPAWKALDGSNVMYQMRVCIRKTIEQPAAGENFGDCLPY